MGRRDQEEIALDMEAGRLTRELLGEGGRAREQAEGRVGVEVERGPDADGGVRILGLRADWLWANWCRVDWRRVYWRRVDGLRRHGTGAVAAWTRGRDGGSSEGGEDSSKESEELHDGVYDVYEVG